MVHTLLTPKQVKESPKAQAALKSEADKLQRRNTWLLNTVREAADVLAEARRTGVLVLTLVPKVAEAQHVVSARRGTGVPANGGATRPA